MASTLGHVSFTNPFDPSAGERSVSARDAYDVWSGKQSMLDVFGIDQTSLSEQELEAAWGAVHSTYTEGMHTAFLGALAANIEGPEIAEQARAEFADLKGDRETADRALDTAATQAQNGEQVHDVTASDPSNDRQD